MSTTLYHIALLTRIVGITIMAGTSFIDYITFKAFYKAYTADAAKGIVLENYLYKLQRFLGIGMLLILLSGVAMMIKLHEVWGAQLWFRIKMGLLLLVIINGLGLRRRLGARLKKIIANNTSLIVPGKKWNRIKRDFTIVQFIQLFLFLIIFTLSVFKFN